MLIQPRIGDEGVLLFSPDFLCLTIDLVSVSGESIRLPCILSNIPLIISIKLTAPIIHTVQKPLLTAQPTSISEDLYLRLLNMTIFTIAAAACLFAAVAYTAPAPVEDRQFRALITFIAGPVELAQSVLTDDAVFPIST